jgi:UrcA family protein
MNTLTATNRIPSLIATALLGAMASALTAQPAAANGVEPLQVTVKYADLNVSHPQGAAVLYGRIRAAAAVVCAPFDRGGLSVKLHRDACVDNAIADAVTAVNEPALLAVYGTKTGKTPPVRVALAKNP